jgi:hypothetical protein
MLNLVQHLIKSTGYETLNRVQKKGDKQGLFHHPVKTLLVDFTAVKRKFKFEKKFP